MIFVVNFREMDLKIEQEQSVAETDSQRYRTDLRKDKDSLEKQIDALESALDAQQTRLDEEEANNKINIQDIMYKGVFGAGVGALVPQVMLPLALQEAAKVLGGVAGMGYVLIQNCHESIFFLNHFFS